MIIPVVVGAVVLLLLLRGQGGPGLFDGLLGRQPPVGGADGSPQAQSAANYSQTRPVGNSEQNMAHGLESAIGGGVAAGVCTYYGAGAAAPICAKVGAYLGPKAVALGNFTTLKTVDYSVKVTDASLGVVKKGAGLGTAIASAGSSLGDRAYAGAGHLPGPLGTLGKLSVAPVKVVANLGKSVAGAGEKVVGGIVSGAKGAEHAVAGGVHKVLGWL
jgi:hypothetical protein